MTPALARDGTTGSTRRGPSSGCTDPPNILANYTLVQWSIPRASNHRILGRRRRLSIAYIVPDRVYRTVQPIAHISVRGTIRAGLRSIAPPPHDAHTIVWPRPSLERQATPPSGGRAAACVSRVPPNPSDDRTRAGPRSGRTILRVQPDPSCIGRCLACQSDPLAYWTQHLLGDRDET